MSTQKLAHECSEQHYSEKQKHKWPSPADRINKMWTSQTMEYWGHRRNKVPIQAMTWTDPVVYPLHCSPMDYVSPLGSSVHGIFQAKILEWVPFPTLGDLPNPEIKAVSLASPALAGGFFTTVASGNKGKKHIQNRLTGKEWAGPTFPCFID